MSEFKIEIPEFSPCNHCNVDVALNITVCPNCDNNIFPRITVPDLLIGFTSGQIIDARSGGLVLGRDNPEDDIPMYIAVIPGVLQLSGLMHGGEFIVNNVASYNQRERLLEINSYKESVYIPMAEIPLSPTTRIFNTNGVNGNSSNLALLIQTGQFIANRAATRKYYSELIEINDSAQPNLG